MRLPPVRDDCPPRYGNCQCQCHYVPGVSHCLPCCYPEHDKSFTEILLDIINERQESKTTEKAE